MLRLKSCTSRLRTYPLLVFLTLWAVLVVNVALRSGWLGFFGQLIAEDFVVFYSTGSIAWSAPQHLYDQAVQEQVQLATVAPTVPSSINPFVNPPYVALALSVLPLFPYASSLAVWALLNAACAVGAGVLLFRFLRTSVSGSSARGSSLSQPNVLLALLSFMPFFEGFEAGQPVGITLLLSSVMALGTISGAPVPAGVAAGLLIYKPQLVAGMLVVWCAWRSWKSLVAFACVAAAWIGIDVALHGVAQYEVYREVSTWLLTMPIQERFPHYLTVTLLGLSQFFVPASLAPSAWVVSPLLMTALGVCVAWAAVQHRADAQQSRGCVVSLALLYPLIASPHALMHDLVVVAPALVVASRFVSAGELLSASLAVYWGALALLMVGCVCHVPLLPLIPVAVFAWQLRHLAGARSR